MDEFGRSSVRDSNLKWKRKSEISKDLSQKSVISIKGANNYHCYLNQGDPFNAANNSNSIAGSNGLGAGLSNMPLMK